MSLTHHPTLCRLTPLSFSCALLLQKVHERVSLAPQGYHIEGIVGSSRTVLRFPIGEWWRSGRVDGRKLWRPVITRVVLPPICSQHGGCSVSFVNLRV